MTAGNTIYSCDLSVNGNTTNALAHGIYSVNNFCGTGNDDYCVFGRDASNTLFCCSTSSATYNNLEKLSIAGASGSDSIYLWYSTANLDRHTAGVTDFEGQVLGRSGNDWIEGSHVIGNNYKDSLDGEGGADTISGHDGDDQLKGDDGDDVLDGGPDDDTIFGNDGSDTISGGTGVDEVYGGIGADYISGGNGADVLFGEVGEDVICGDAGSDELYGNDDLDILWGNDAGDQKYGGNPISPGGDECDSNGTTNDSCETVTTSMARPACP